MNEHSFCRILLKDVMVEVRKKFSSEDIKSAWAWDVSGGRRRQFEFHGPNGHYDHDVRGADCKWSAAAGGWQRLLEKAAEPVVSGE
jgi:hypothetical protein